MQFYKSPFYILSTTGWSVLGRKGSQQAGAGLAASLAKQESQSEMGNLLVMRTADKKVALKSSLSTCMHVREFLGINPSYSTLLH